MVSKHLPSDADGEGPLMPVPALDYGHFPAEEAAGPVEDLVGVAVLGGRDTLVRMRVADTVMRVRHLL